MSASDEQYEEHELSFLNKERTRLRKDFDSIQDFVFERQYAGELTEAQLLEIFDVYLKTIVADAGITTGLGSNAMDLAVLRHANHLARAALKAMLPMHAKEIDGLNSARRH